MPMRKKEKIAKQFEYIHKEKTQEYKKELHQLRSLITSERYIPANITGIYNLFRK